jgi:predicted secreted hydrolase
VTKLWEKRRATGLVVAAAVVLTAVVSPSAQASSPVLVNPAVDLGAHTHGPDPTENDSIYVTSMVEAGGHHFGVLVHTLRFPNTGENIVALSVTDKKTGWYRTYQTLVAPEDYHWSQGRLDITAPGLRWTGNANGMAVHVTTPWGSLDVKHVRTGPVMYYAGTGQIDLIDVKNFEFAFPSLKTVGKLVIDGRKYAIAGDSWLDRQWGPLPPTLNTWSWMNLSMPNGDKVAVWDVATGGGENPWAMVLHPNGSYEVVDVEPLAVGATAEWTSPVSGNTYPTRWHVRIPALRAQFDVRVTGTQAQELPAIGKIIIGRLEATAEFTGTYRGRPVSGENFVELVGPGWS